MPLAFLLGLVENAAELPSMSWFKACLKPEDIVYIGLRDLDRPEKAIIKKLGIKAFTMNDIDRLGIGRVMEECLSHFSGKENLHLSYDIDALDPFYAPSTGTAVRGGLTFREGNYICEALAESGKMTSMELVEVNPSLHSDMDAKTTIVRVRICSILLVLDRSQMIMIDATGLGYGYGIDRKHDGE